MHYKKLVGERIYLSPIDVENEVAILTKWVNEDHDIAVNNGFYNSTIDLNKMQEKLDNWNSSPSCLAIVRSLDDAFMGQVSLFDYRGNNTCATLGIFIGPEYRNQGYGQEAMNLICDFAFKNLRLEAIHLEVFSFNEKAIKSYENNGFVRCGRYRRSYYFDGQYHDIILMEKLNHFNRK